MNSAEIRTRFLEFFRKRGHSIIRSASLITSDEKGITNPTLFNTAGMQPLVPYLLGKDHPDGKRLANVQKCLRTVDIDDVGDRTHATFFEMLGNWSLGDYFKKDAINWSYEFLTSKTEGLGLDPNRLYVTVFEGDKVAPRDTEAASIWKEIFEKNNVNYGSADGSGTSRIFFLGASSNWWEAGDNGPCGPDSEMYYDISNKFGGKLMSHDDFLMADSKRDVVEVWNDVFMQYEKKDGKIVGNLPKPSIDTGAGLERLAMTLQAVDNIYDTDIFKPIMAAATNELGQDCALTSRRIVSDHMRASVFLIGDGVIPGNTARGYVLRRLIRRAVRNARGKNGNNNVLARITEKVFDIYQDSYPELSAKKESIIKEIDLEETRFRETLVSGMKEVQKLLEKKGTLNGSDAFYLYQSYGFPIELTKEELGQGKLTDEHLFHEEMKKHQDLSRIGAEQKFKGGLADGSDPMIIRYHTATHLLHQALHDVLGDSVMQKGSNITAERLRFDFSHAAKMTDEEKKRVEEIVNTKINEALPVKQVIMNKTEAEKTGSRHFFNEKYEDQISIYFVGNSIENAYSKEYCGGPHVTNTSDLKGPDGKWKFIIQKEEAVSQGVRRIKAVLK